MTQSVICIAQGQITVTRSVCLVVNRSAVADVEAWLNNLVEYDKDEDAGAVVGLLGWYRTSDSHDSLPGGLPKQVRYL